MPLPRPPTLLLLVAVLAAMLASSSLDAKPLEPCPSPCRCFLSEGLKRADCRKVPEYADRSSDAQDVRILPLPSPARTGPTSFALHLSHFDVFPKVLQLAVTNRSLVKVIPNDAHGLQSLQELDLSHNLLSRFNDKVFLHLPALRRLVLADNPIVLEKDMFTSKSLLSLDLSHCEIVDVPRGALDGLRNLTSLSLKGNPLRLEKGRPLLGDRSNVAELDLSACELDAIPEGVLAGLTKLRRLYLDRNYLHVVQKGVLPVGLHLLDLSGNRIREAPTAVISSLNSLNKLALHDNPIHCTCSLIGLQGWLSRNLVVVEHPVVCDEPAEYRGKSWTKVDELKLCRAEQTSYASESSSVSDESSSDDQSSSSASANAAAPDVSMTEDDDSIDQPPYEVYMHDNVIGGHSSSMPTKLALRTLDDTPRVVSHNDIFFQADQPYEVTTTKETAEQAVETTTTPETPEPVKTEEEPAKTEEEPDKDNGRESMESDADDGSEDADIGDETDAGKDSDAHDAPDGEDEATEKDAEVVFRNADTIAMGKSMPDNSAQEEKQDVEVATDAPVEAPAPEAAAHEEVSETSATESAATEPAATSVPSHEAVNEGLTEGAEQESQEHGEEHHENEAESSGEQQHLGGAVIDEATALPPTEAIATSNEGQHESEGLGAAEEAGEEATTLTPDTTTATSDETVVPVAVGHADGDRSDYGRDLDEEHPREDHPEGEHHEGEQSGGEHHDGEKTEGEHPEGEHPQEEHHEGDGAAIVPIPDSSPEPSTALPDTANEHETGEGEHGEHDTGILVPAVPSEDSAAVSPEPSPSAPVEAVEEEIVPEVAKNIVGTGEEGDGEVPATEAPSIAVVPAIVESVPEIRPEPEPVTESIPAPKSAVEVGAAAVPALEGAAEKPMDAETVDGVPDDAKRNEELAVERVPGGQVGAADEDSELQKSTITYVILGCIVLAMVVLVLYALLRSKAKQADNGSGGKPARIRRENGDARTLSHPEGTEMKDMMNPLLPGATHPDHPEHAEHGRRTSLTSLELIREEEDETTRLQPPGADAVEGTLPPAKGAATASGKTPDAERRPVNGKTVANGKPASPATPAEKSLLAPTPTQGAGTTPTASPRLQRAAAEQPSKVTVKAGVISTPVPRTPVLVNRANGANGVHGKNGVNGVNGKVNGLDRSA